jgi:hypothetical protein
MKRKVFYNKSLDYKEEIAYKKTTNCPNITEMKNAGKCLYKTKYKLGDKPKNLQSLEEQGVKAL